MQVRATLSPMTDASHHRAGAAQLGGDELAALRREYADQPLDPATLADDPRDQVRAWVAEAGEAGEIEPNAMTLATVDDEACRPTVRTVLLKGIDAGFVFYTNLESRKSRSLAGNPQAGLLLRWDTLARQVSIEGKARPVPDAEADAYWATRPRGSQLGAWASAQSQPVADRAALDRALEEATRRFGDEPIPRPPHWGGWRVHPVAVEVWQGRTVRLHDRLRYRLVGDGWEVVRLAP